MEKFHGSFVKYAERTGADVTEEDIAVKIEGHEHEIGSLMHRMKNQEEQTKVIQDLVLSVKELAMNMKNMIDEQKEQSERLAKLEKEPAERWNAARNTAFTTVVSVISGSLATGLLIMIAQYLK